MSNTDILNEEQVAEIEARPYIQVGWGRRVELTVDERDALCRTLRAAWNERLEIQRVLASAVLEDPTEDDDPPYSTSELVEGVRWLLHMKDAKQARVTALREQLAETELIRDQLSSGLSVRDAQLKEIESRLAQVEKEQYEPCVTCACGRPSWHRKGDEPL